MKIIKPSIILESDMLTLRELKSSDVTQQYIDWLNDPEVNQYLESRLTHQDEVSIKVFVETCQQSKVIFLLGMFVEGGINHIGNIKLGPVNMHHDCAEIGLMIGDKGYWGKGFASKAISMITQFGFKQLKLSKLSASCYKDNIGSKKAFEKSGYKVEKLIRNNVDPINGGGDSLILRCLKSDFILID
jgi:RimJ/RimL family protein N-acetyltransferase